MSQPLGSLERSSTGLPANVAAALSYAAWFASGLALLLLEKESRFVRFHAMQSTLLFLIVAVGYVVAWFVPAIGWLVASGVWLVGFVLWLVLLVKAYRGEWYRVGAIGSLAGRWLAQRDRV